MLNIYPEEETTCRSEGLCPHTLCRSQAAEREGMLTLHVPGPPDGVVEADLVSPEQLQTFEVLPLGRDQLPAERQDKPISNARAGTRVSRQQQFRILTSILLLLLYIVSTGMQVLALYSFCKKKKSGMGAII